MARTKQVSMNEALRNVWLCCTLDMAHAMILSLLETDRT
jgi:hypothetical protein